MAKKKAATKAAGDDRAIVISVKGTAAFRDWLADVAARERITAVQLIEKAVVEYAGKRKYPAAPRRTVRGGKRRGEEL